MSKIIRAKTIDYATQESLTRANLFISEKMADKYKCTCNSLFKNGFNPYITTLVATETLYKKLIGPLRSMPTQDKNTLAVEVKNNMLNIRKHIIRSASIDSISVQEAKEASCSLVLLISNLDLMCGLNYLSNALYSELFKLTSDIDTCIKLWFQVLAKHKNIN